MLAASPQSVRCTIALGLEIGRFVLRIAYMDGRGKSRELGVRKMKSACSQRWSFAGQTVPKRAETHWGSSRSADALPLLRRSRVGLS